MRELVKLDVIMQKVSKLLKSGNKAKRIIKAVTFGWTLFNVIAVIWSLVPKTDKLDEVNADELIDALTPEEIPVQPVIMPETAEV